jgi:hypothetical protein
VAQLLGGASPCKQVVGSLPSQVVGHAETKLFGCLVADGDAPRDDRHDALAIRSENAPTEVE